MPSLDPDGGNPALRILLHAGFDGHDEILVQLPAADAAIRAAEVENITVASLEAGMGHGIPAAVDQIVADCR